MQSLIEIEARMDLDGIACTLRAARTVALRVYVPLLPKDAPSVARAHTNASADRGHGRTRTQGALTLPAARGAGWASGPTKGGPCPNRPALGHTSQLSVDRRTARSYRKKDGRESIKGDKFKRT